MKRTSPDEVCPDPKRQKKSAGAVAPLRGLAGDAAGALVTLDLRASALSRLPAALEGCSSLRQLDIGGNPIASLEGLAALPQLRILFATGCSLGPVLPAHGPLAQSNVFMLSVKSNGLTELDGNALPESMGWLIAAENQISKITNAHRLANVRKCMLSHNKINADTLGPAVAQMTSLEMLRIACNDLKELPRSLVSHTRLAWLALGGNPYADACYEALDKPDGAQAALLEDGDAVEVTDHVLGSGSGAVVKRGRWQGKDVAVKLWSSTNFSDGSATGEWRMGRLTGGCPDLVSTLAAWHVPALGMAVELLEGARAVGGPPSFASVTRDTFDASHHPVLSPAQAVEVALTVARACEWMHARGLVHGDVYLHNTLMCEHPSVFKLSDLGAGAAYDAHKDPLEKIEVRSFGWLLQDLIARLPEESEVARTLSEIAEGCACDDIAALPTFSILVQQLVGLAGKPPVFACPRPEHCT